MVEVTGLFVYPVKSMRGIELGAAHLTPLGLEHDRRFMVVRENGEFVTQRNLPLLALIETALEPGGVVLSRQGFGHIFVPFDAEGGATLNTRVWKDKCLATDQGDTISRWLTEALESTDRLLLVAMQSGFERPQGKADMLGADTRTLFADAAPFLIANEASLARLNRELVERGHLALPMNRFRPNIVIRGPDAFAEHRIGALSNGDYGLAFCHPCERCVVTTIDQSTAVRNPDREPYNTLAEINPMPGRDKKPAFGHNAILSGARNRTIRTGDRLELLERNP